MASPENNTAGSSTSTVNDDPDTSTSPLTMENSLVGKLNEGRYYINKAGEEFQKCAERLDEPQIESIRQTHIRLVVLRLVGSALWVYTNGVKID